MPVKFMIVLLSYFNRILYSRWCVHCVFWEMRAITALINIQQNVITSARLQVIFFKSVMQEVTKIL